MMVRVKELYETNESDSLETQINNWLRTNGKNMRLIDIKYQSIRLVDSEGDVNWKSSALILYEERQV